MFVTHFGVGQNVAADAFRMIHHLWEDSSSHTAAAAETNTGQKYRKTSELEESAWHEVGIHSTSVQSSICFMIANCDVSIVGTYCQCQVSVTFEQ